MRLAGALRDRSPLGRDPGRARSDGGRAPASARRRGARPADGAQRRAHAHARGSGHPGRQAQQRCAASPLPQHRLRRHRPLRLRRLPEIARALLRDRPRPVVDQAVKPFLPRQGGAHPASSCSACAFANTFEKVTLTTAFRATARSIRSTGGPKLQVNAELERLPIPQFNPYVTPVGYSVKRGAVTVRASAKMEGVATRATRRSCSPTSRWVGPRGIALPGAIRCPARSR